MLWFSELIGVYSVFDILWYILGPEDRVKPRRHQFMSTLPSERIAITSSCWAWILANVLSSRVLPLSWAATAMARRD